MQTKLTLRLDDELIKIAKAHAKKSGLSVSQMVAAYFSLLDEPPPVTETVTPIVASLRGILHGAEVDEADYRHHLEEKYR